MADTLQTIHEIDNIDIARTIECDSSELTKHIHVNKNDLTIISQNIRSIYRNFDDFILTLSDFNFETDIIILTECRLNASKQIPQLTNYHSYVTTCQLNQNDGVTVYIKNTLKPKVKEIKLSQASCIQLDLLSNIVLCVYRSPSNSNADCFINTLNAHIETLHTQKNIIIAGDININIKPKTTEQSYEHRNRINYLHMLSIHGILPGHILPTRERNCLDHFMLKINKRRLSPFIAILHTTTTDHFTTFLSLTKIKNFQTSKKTYKTIDFEGALRYLQEKNLAELLFCDDPCVVTECLIRNLMESINENSILKVIPNSKRIIKPWITSGILRCIKNRNKLQKKLRNDPYNEILKITYTRYRNYCNNVIKKIKRNYERDLIINSVKNNKLLWKNIKNITFTNKSKYQSSDLLHLHTTPSLSVNYVNNFFANIGKSLAQQIQPRKTSEPYANFHNSSTQVSSFVLLDTDPDEVDRVLMNLRSDSAPGWDNISTKYLKFARKEVVLIIAHLANLCFRKGVFPAQLKLSIITPVHKGGDGDDVNNYRPISVLPVISKILEKLINIRLLSFLNRYNILSPNQFGFRQGKSTEDAVLALSSLVTKHLDLGRKCLTVFLDLKKAFDTVSVPILVSKLEKIGIRGIPLILLKDYLSDRKQRVKIEQYTSDDMDITYGVPQGSVLGPTLFLVYINDLCNLNVENAKVFSYADDTAVFFSGDSWGNLKISVEKGMALMGHWLGDNVLTLNTVKTNYICFSLNSRSQPEEDFSIRIHTCDDIYNKTCNCQSIQKVGSVRYLGVLMDYRLSWHAHLEQVTGRVRKLIWLFRVLRRIVPRKISYDDQCSSKNLLNGIYVSLVQSVLVYCIPVWGGASKTKFIELERAQRALIKVMYFKKMDYSTENIYILSNILSVRKLYILQIVLKMHKALPYDRKIENKRRMDYVVQVPTTKTTFAAMQYNRRSSYLYNKINKELNIFNKNYHECKNRLYKWLKLLNYEETENVLRSIQ